MHSNLEVSYKIIKAAPEALSKEINKYSDFYISTSMKYSKIKLILKRRLFG